MKDFGEKAAHDSHQYRHLAEDPLPATSVTRLSPPDRNSTSIGRHVQFCEVSVSRNIHTSHEAESDFERKKCIKTFSSKNDLDNY
uniref:Uncharacterized protein n=1 Tax=Timema genevievae TaxID=629358 RepID=A0A7R9JSL2_TIMGE|nr:unnamed protein product [Timema genevievae]